MFLSAYWIDSVRFDVTDQDMRESIKAAGRALEYPTEYGIDIERLDTHSLRSGGANQLAMAEYSEMEIQKMVDGKGTPSRSIYGKSSHASWRACRKP